MQSIARIVVRPLSGRRDGPKLGWAMTPGYGVAMRWASYTSERDGLEHVAVVTDGSLHALPPGESLLELLRGDRLDAAARSAVESPWETVSLDDARLLAPVAVPPSIRDFMSFENHVVTSMAALGGTVDPVWYEQPVFYFTNPAAVVGPRDDIPVSPGSVQFDFELEVAAVIGVGGSDIAPVNAEHHIAGYTILCDWSARDLQETEMRVGLGPAKGKDTATTLGPLLVSPDELEPFRTERGFDLGMTVDVNGKRYSAGNWSSIYWTFPQMIAYASRGTTLRPGDVIGSGTVGTGCILELSRVHGHDTYPWLQPGDVVRVEVEQLGTIESTIVAGPPVVSL
jgi:2-keto-4-pentenoate hydratase/2-oxohepta-3-ene-1,7-dioic acid hydratase in catechol pathway